MKSPPEQIVDDEARELTEQFIERYRRGAPNEQPAEQPAKSAAA